MMNVKLRLARRLFLSCLCLIMVVGNAAAGGTKLPEEGVFVPPGKLEPFSLFHQGRKRQFFVYRPERKWETDVPLVVVLHGGGYPVEKATPERFQSFLNYGFERLAEAEDLLVVYPFGNNGYWNDGRAAVRRDSENAEDLGFFKAMLAYLKQEFPVNKKQVYFVGISNGGVMSYRLACEMADEIAGIGAVAALLPVEWADSCRLKNPLDIVILHGTEDKWDGCRRHCPRGEFMSAIETLSFWRKANGCSPVPRSEKLSDLYRFDGSSVIHDRYDSCRKNRTVDFYKIIGGGHTWPGGKQYLPRFLIGSTNRDIDAAEKIWASLGGH